MATEGLSLMGAMKELVERYSIRLPERVYKNQIRQAIRELERQGRMEDAWELVDYLKRGASRV